MLGEKNDPYDVIISGAGPAGLTAGIEAGRNHLSAIIFEKEDHPGKFPRGETVHSAKIFTKILGSDILNMIGTHFTAARRFYSPEVKHQAEVYRHTPSIVYNWKEFVELLLDRLEETSTELRCSTLVKQPIYENRICIGVELESGEKIYGKTTLICEGHSSSIGQQLGVPYNQINCPVVKRAISNFQGTYSGFEYYLIPATSLAFALRFPPCSIFVFPHGKDKCEVGLIVFTPLVEKLQEYCDTPSEEQIMETWKLLVENYPQFSDLMKNTKTEFEGLTKIAMGNVYEQVMPKMGIILVGGTIGFVEASGGSGIGSSMKMAHYVIEYLIHKKIEYWTPARANRFIRDLKNKGFWKHIMQNSKKTRRMWKILFVKLRTAKAINNSWSLIKRFI